MDGIARNYWTWNCQLKNRCILMLTTVYVVLSTEQSPATGYLRNAIQLINAHYNKIRTHCKTEMYLNTDMNWYDVTIITRSDM
jgi:hypothetical protein